MKGMEAAKRAVEVAAAGGHNLLLVGPPGAGKSMLACRLPGLLPDLTPAEALEVSTIHSVAGMLSGGLMVKRPPYREPHHSASPAALTGGGQRARPGEVSLAHRGVLFLDELPEFPRPALEALRTPLETGRTTVARAAAHITYPARFQLIAAMNPCRCGHLGDPARECGKAPRCGEDYLGRISGPLLDRIDMTVQVQPIAPAELSRAPGRRAERCGGGPRRGGAGGCNAAGARSTPRPTWARWSYSPTPAPWRNRQPRNCACRREGSRGCCGWPVRWRIWADQRWCGGWMWPKRLAFRHRVPGRGP